MLRCALLIAAAARAYDNASAGAWNGTVAAALARRAAFAPAAGLLFVRVPKTGSSTTRAVVGRLCDRFNCSRIADHPDDRAGLAPSYADVYRAHEPPGGYRCNVRHLELGPWLLEAFPTLARSLLVSVAREPVARARSVVRNRESFCGLSFDEDTWLVTHSDGDVNDADELVVLSERCALLRDGAFRYLNVGGRLATARAVVDYYDALLVLEDLAASLLVLLYAPYFAGAAPICDFAFETLRSHPEPSRAHRTAAQNQTRDRQERLWRHDVSPTDVELYDLAAQRFDRARRAHDRAARRRGDADAAALGAALAACPAPAARRRR